MSLELGEGVFDGIEVGAVGRQIEQPCACRFDGLANACDLVGGQIVHDDDVAGTQGRCQHLLAPGSKDLAIHRPVEQHRGDEAVEGQAADEGDGLPVPVRDGGAAALALRGPAAQARHVGREPAFVDENQALWIELGLPLGPALTCGFYVGTVLFAGVSGLFLCVWSWRSRNFQTAVLATLTPRSAASRSTISASVVSGFSLTRPRMNSAWPSSTEPFGRP